MQFNEKQLVDAYWARATVWSHNPLNDNRHNYHESRTSKRRTRYKLLAHREFTLPSGKRCDVLVKDKAGRFVWIIEFKVVADPKAIRQVADYWSEARTELQLFAGRSICGSAVTIAAQFFTEDAIWFARQLGIQLVHVAPMNSSMVSIHEILKHNQPLMTKGVFNG